jgi:hypothetical protein
MNLFVADCLKRNTDHTEFICETASFVWFCVSYRQKWSIIHGIEKKVQLYVFFHLSFSGSPYF